MKIILIALVAAIVLAQTRATDYAIVALAPISGVDRIPAERLSQWSNVLQARAQAITTAWSNGHTLSVTIQDTESSKFRALQFHCSWRSSSRNPQLSH